MPSARTPSVARLLALARSPPARARSPAPPRRPRFTAIEMMRLERLSPTRSPRPTAARSRSRSPRIDLAAGTEQQRRARSCPLAGGEPRRVAASPAERLAAALEPRRPAARVPLDARRLAAGVGGRRERRRAERLTSLPSGVYAFEWIDDGRLLVTTDVWPDCGADAGCDCTGRRQRAKDGSTARAYDELLRRHWDTWSRRPAQPPARRADRRRRERSTSRRAPTPPPIGLGREDGLGGLARRQGGVLLAQGARPTRRGARTRTCSWCRRRAESRSASARAPATTAPAGYSPDGTLLAWRAQERAGYESDRWELMVARPADRRRALAHGRPRPAGRVVRVLARRTDDRTSRSRTTAAPRFSLCAAAAPVPPRRLLDAATLGDLARAARRAHARRHRGEPDAPRGDRAVRHRRRRPRPRHARERRAARAASRCARARACATRARPARPCRPGS